VLCNGRIVARGPATELLAGVGTSEDFDHRFRVSDFMGPLRLEDIGPEPDESDGAWSIDQRVVWVGVIGLVLVASLVVLTTGAPLTGLR
jgi:hypothetical protein